VSANVAGQFENLVQLADTVQGIVELYGGIYAAPGTPIGDEDPLFFQDLPTKMLSQFRNKAHQGTYLGGIPIDSVVQATIVFMRWASFSVIGPTRSFRWLRLKPARRLAWT
jgi:hypothetical protein